jgi:hypothetical protein
VGADCADVAAAGVLVGVGVGASSGPQAISSNAADKIKIKRMATKKRFEFIKLSFKSEKHVDRDA